MKIRGIASVFMFLSATVPFDSAQAEDSFPGIEWERVTLTESGLSEAELPQARAFSERFAGSAIRLFSTAK